MIFRNKKELVSFTWKLWVGPVVALAWLVTVTEWQQSFFSNSIPFLSQFWLVENYLVGIWIFLEMGRQAGKNIARFFLNATNTKSG